MCPHATTIYVSSTTICSALILLHLGPNTAADAIEARDPINVYICVLLLLYMCPHTTYMSHHSATSRSAYCYICVLIQVKVLTCALIEALDSYCYITAISRMRQIINCALIAAHNSWNIPVYVSSYGSQHYYMCPHTSISSALILLY